MKLVRIHETYLEVLMDRNLFLTATKLSTHVPFFFSYIYISFKRRRGKHHLTDILEVTNTHITGTII